MRIEQVTTFLYALKPEGIRFGLENTRMVLERLGRPDRCLRVVHIAGSNGKGSTAAFLDSSLREAGFRPGLYTSPHLVHFRERFRIGGTPVSDAAVESAAERLLSVGLELDPREIAEWVDREGLVGKMDAGSWYRLRGGASSFCRLTFFECTTVLAVLLFAEAGVDLAIMECGMGGRLDATNVFSPLLSVITPIHLEHTEWLGDTLGAIAGEKAGIIKPGVPVICARQALEAERVIRSRAAEVGAELILQGEGFDASGGWRDTTVRFGGRAVGPVRLGLWGDHQVDNAALAAGCLPHLERCGFEVGQKQLRRGLERVVWPGRFERFGPSGRWVLDAAHNPDGARVLARAIGDVFCGQKIRLVFGVLRDKRAEEMLAQLSPLASQIDLVRSQDDRARDPATLAPLLDRPARLHQTVEAALERHDLPEETEPVVVCGSLTVAGEARSWLLKKGFAPVGPGGAE